MSFQGPNLDIVKCKTDRLIIDERLEYGYETITAAGAISVETPVSYLVSGGAIACTLANGYEGQRKLIVMITDGGDVTLTPANFTNGTTITFDNYDTWEGIFHAGSWVSINTPTATVA
jgi:hypothetical protein